MAHIAFHEQFYGKMWEAATSIIRPLFMPKAISPGIIITPLAKDELCGSRGAVPSRRAGTPDEVGNIGALLMRPGGAFITGSDFLMDGGVTVVYWFGDLASS
jgi:hypothetical protein